MINFAGIDFKGLKKQEILNLNNELKFVATLNSEFIVLANEDAEFKKMLSGAICTFDGQIPFWLAKLKNVGNDFEKISGSDFIYDACKWCQENKGSLFLLGGKEKSNALAVEKIKKLYPGVAVQGYSPPFSAYPFKEDINDEIKKRISMFKPTFVFVGFGAYKQERWIVDHLDLLRESGVKLVIGSGGTFEFVSETIKRAPRFIQNIGMEGVFRFMVEPKLFRLVRLLKSFKIFKYI